MAKRSKGRKSSSKKSSKSKTRSKSKSRKLTTSAKAKTTSASEVNKHMHVVMNPFSQATQHPKLPDGSVPSSLSRRLRNTQSFTASTSGYTDILVSPTFGNVATFFAGSMVNLTGVGWLGTPGQTAGITSNLVGAGPYSMSAAGNIAKQRIVSQAIRLTQINNDEENDGWYECCRIVLPKTPTHFLIGNMDNSTTAMNGVKPAVLAPDRTIELGYLNSLPLVEQPGYTSGMLKDLKNKEFRLQPIGCECHMNEAYKIVDMFHGTGTSADINVDANDRWGNFNATSKSVDVLELGLDDSWDYVLVRIHGRQVAASPSSFIIEGIQNVEFCFSPNSDLATFMTPNVRHKLVKEALDKLNNSPKAEAAKTG